MTRQGGMLLGVHSCRHELTTIGSSEMSAFSNETTNFHVYENSYVFPYAITALASTSTRFGITSKDLLGSSAINSLA